MSLITTYIFVKIKSVMLHTETVQLQELVRGLGDSVVVRASRVCPPACESQPWLTNRALGVGGGGRTDRMQLTMYTHFHLPWLHCMIHTVLMYM